MIKRSLFLLFILFSASQLWAQKTDKANLDKAKALYKAGNFEAAKPLFEEEYNAKPADAALNQWYGVCLYKTGGNLKKVEACLKLAAKKNIVESYLYLGDVYVQSYRFSEASVLYDKYAHLKRHDKIAMATLNRSKSVMAKVQNAALHPENIQIIDSLVVNKSDFLSAYHLGAGSGKVLTYDAVFGATKNVDATVCFNGKGTKIYYAKPAQNGIYQLYTKEKLLSGFANEKTLSPTSFGFADNLNYPFMLSDGVTVYFAAQDSTGFGGYDLYVTRYNSNSDSYLTPERLNMPFNSNANDYMLVIDDEKGIGWFASDRFQPDGQVCIYTFIPNDKVEMLPETAPADYLTRRARIESIKDSWRVGVDYSKLIALARTDAKPKEKEVHDFEFVINDAHTYTSYADFKSKEARDIYLNARESCLNYVKLQAELANKRDTYAQASSSEKQKLAYSITDMETQLPSLYKKIKTLEIQARNMEINYLNK